MRTARPTTQGVSTPSSGATSRTGAVRRDQSRDTENTNPDWSGKKIIKRIQKRKSKKVGHHSSGTNILGLAPREKHNTVQHRHRNEAKVWAWTVERAQDYPRSQKLPSPFPERSERTDCTRWVICTESKKPAFRVRKPIY